MSAPTQLRRRSVLTDPTALPPGPRTPTLVQTLLMFGLRDRCMPYWQRKYGHTFSLRLAPAGSAVVISRPEDIKTVFSGTPTTFHAGEGNAILGPVMGQHSVLLLDEEAHLKARRAVMAAFRGETMAAYGDMVAAIAEDDMDRWPVGSTFSLHEHMNDVSLEVILRIVFGMGEGARLTALRPLLQKMVQIGPLVIMGWVRPELQSFGPWRRYRTITRRADGVIQAEITHRRAEGDLADRTDVLSKLIVADPTMSDIELRDHLVTLLLAGHETTASTLAWTFHELTRRPEVMRRARQAAEDGDSAYISAVIKESLRLRPVIYEVARRLTEPVTIGAYDLPAGVVVFPAIGLVQRNPAVFAEPDEFRPERFLGASPPNSTWIPFGGGVRRCLGAALATLEAETVLVAILRRMDVQADRQRPEPTRGRNITLVPGRGARVVATPRARTLT